MRTTYILVGCALFNETKKMQWICSRIERSSKIFISFTRNQIHTLNICMICTRVSFSTINLLRQIFTSIIAFVTVLECFYKWINSFLWCSYFSANAWKIRPIENWPWTVTKTWHLLLHCRLLQWLDMSHWQRQQRSEWLPLLCTCLHVHSRGKYSAMQNYGRHIAFQWLGTCKFPLPLKVIFRYRPTWRYL